MKKSKTQHKNYTKIDGGYQLVLPLSFEALIPEDDSVRLLRHVLEGLNYEKLYSAYSSMGRKSVVEPKILFRILTYSYMNNIYSSRKIETACRRDINFMWLLEGYKAPDHSTIARFRKTFLADAAEDLFYQLVLYLNSVGEINFENLFIDGTKIEANANKYTFVWKKTVIKNQEKMFIKMQELTLNLNTSFKTTFSVNKDTMLEDISSILSYLDKIKNENDIVFVHGIGKRKTQVQKFTETFQDFYVRQQKYNECNKIFNERNSYSKTDSDATFMHMKDDHMRNSQLKPGYNVQIGVEAEYIVGVNVFSNRTDIGTLIPFLDSLENRLKRCYEAVTADSGYESEENYMYLEGKNIKYYIKPQTYEKWKKRSFKNDISKRENMDYDASVDQYTCHNKKVLRPIKVVKRASASGYKAEVTIYECEDCSKCEKKAKCTKAKDNRRMQVSKLFIEKRQTSYENIISEKGILLRINRSIQVEGAFGVLKEDYGFKRFLTRGKNNVKNELLLLCFGYNMNKFHSKIQNDRCGQHLHKPKIA